MGGTVYGGAPYTNQSGPACVVDTDDSSQTAPNFAAVWVAQNNYPQSKPSVVFCSVNGHNPIPVGYDSNAGVWRQATNPWVAVGRQLTTYNGNSVMVVAVAWNYDLGAVYAQVFLVNPSTGSYVSGNPVQMNTGFTPGSLNVGGIAGDDYGNFVVTYVRQGTTEGSNGQGVFASAFNYSNLLTGSTLGFAEFAVQTTNISQNSYSRVACYHGSSSTSGGFVVAWNNTAAGSGLRANRYTTNWTSSPTLQAGTTIYSTGYPFPGTSDYWQFALACVRDTPGSYSVTWTTSSTSMTGGDNGVNNTVYVLINSDSAGTLYYVTDYADANGGDGPCVLRYLVQRSPQRQRL